jgi:hypothetical protein
MANRRIPDLSAEHRAFVKRIQPYHAGDGAPRHPLAVLAELSNADKHRIVNPTFSALESTDLLDELEKLLGPDNAGQPSPFRGYFVAKRAERMEHGTPWLRLLWDRGQEPPRGVNVHHHIQLGIGFGEIGLDAKEFPRIAKGVLSIIQRFQADFPETVFED